MRSNSYPQHVVQVDIKLKESVDRETFTKLLTDLAKHLLLLKSQIPLQFETIAREVELDDQKTLAGALEESVDGYEPAQSREDVRRRKQKLREKRSKAHLLKCGRKLLSDFSAVASCLRTELETGDLLSVSFLFGATSHSAREVYTVQVPATGRSERSEQSRPGLQLYRAMLGHQELGRLTGSSLPVSNMFTVIARRSLPVFSTSLHLPGFTLPPPGRCARANFTFTFPDTETLRQRDGETEATETVRQRLSFYSGAESEQMTPVVCRQPVSMELCTPFQHPSLTTDLRPDHRPDLGPDHRPDIGPDHRPDHRPDLRPDLKPDLRPEPDCMELCTPLPSMRKRQEQLSLGALSLNSPEKKSRVELQELQEVSSGEKEQLYWFILETSVRGFKLKL